MTKRNSRFVRRGAALLLFQGGCVILGVIFGLVHQDWNGSLVGQLSLFELALILK